MIARLLISPLPDVRKNTIGEELRKNDFTRNHPDLLYFEQEEKLGIAEARQIKEHFYLKPYSAKGRMVILEDISEMTAEAQNALLKLLEELPEEAIFILGSSSDANILPTVISRCQVNILNPSLQEKNNRNIKDEDFQKLLRADTAERFLFVEKLKNREEFLLALVEYFHRNLLDYPEFAAEVLQAEKWAKQNVNIRGILEYLMLVMPQQIC